MVLVAWMTFLSASMAFLVGPGGGLLEGPPLLHPTALEGWIRRSMETVPSPAVGAAFAALRLLALAFCGYLLLVTLASLVAHAAGWSRAARIADRRSPSVVSAVVRAGLGFTLSTTGVAAAASVGGGVPIVARASHPATEAFDHGLNDGSHQGHGRHALASLATRSRRGATAGQGPVLQWVEPPRPRRAQVRPTSARPGSAPATPRTPAIVAAPPRFPSAPAASVPTTWTVLPGDSFWSIAAAVLQEAWGRPPTDAEIDSYWLALIAANRRVLLDPGVPDLIYAGQVLAVPAPPPGGGG